MRHVDIEERRRRLVRRHHLAAPAHSLEQIAEDLVGLHSSDPSTVYLSAWARLDGFDPPHLESTLYEDRSLLRLLGMRRTLFVVTEELAPIMLAACTRALVPTERRRMVRMLEEQDLVPDGTAWLATSEARVLEVLGELGAATAKQIKERVPDLDLQFTFGEGTKWAGTVGATTRLMFLMATQADIIRARPLGSWISGQYRWTRVEDWVRSPLRDVDEQEARDELVTRWLRTYGPGTETDIKWWTGWGVRQTRQSLDRIGAVAVEVESGNAFVLPDDVDPEPDQTPTIALLPSLDPAVMGWKERHWFVGPHQERVFDRNGNVGPTVWSDGRIVGAWAQRRDGEIAVGYLEDPGRDAREAIDQRAEELRQWFGEVRTTPRFPAPLDKELRS